MQEKNKNSLDKEALDILRLINNQKSVSQRRISRELGFSIGKVNYIIKNLKKKGLVKLNNLKINMTSKSTKRKVNYLYVITPKGIKEKIVQTNNFLKKISREYDELKKELENID